MTPLVPLAWLLTPANRSLSWRNRLVLFSWFGVIVGFYLFFKAGAAHWWARYLLPGIPAMILAALCVGQDMLKRLITARRYGSMAPTLRRALAVYAVGIILFLSIQQGTRLHVFGIGEGEAVYPDAIRWAAPSLATKSMIVSAQMGTAVETYSTHVPVRWEFLNSELFSELREIAYDNGYRWFALLYPIEEERFRRHVPGDWVLLGRYRQVSLWALPRP